MSPLSICEKACTCPSWTVPGSKTPFLFQGFRIPNNDELEQIDKLCDVVFVDTEKSTIPVPERAAANNGDTSRKTEQDTARIVRAAKPYRNTFDNELPAARDIHRYAMSTTDTLLNDVYPIGSTVELRSGHTGIVISSQPDARLFPRVMLILDAGKRPVERPKTMNLALFREKGGDDSGYEVNRLVNAQDYGIDVRSHFLRELGGT